VRGARSEALSQKKSQKADLPETRPAGKARPPLGLRAALHIHFQIRSNESEP
jgi:hypothetical protein